MALYTVASMILGVGNITIGTILLAEHLATFVVNPDDQTRIYSLTVALAAVARPFTFTQHQKKGPTTMSISRIIHFLPRRLMWSSMLLALLSLTFLLPSAVASASAHTTTAAHHSSSLVGTWTVQFAVGNPPVHVQEVLTFSSDYTLTSPPGTINGLTIGAASGRWSQVNNQIFFVAVFTEFSDPQQTQLIDTTVAQQSGTISGNTFTSSGMGTAYDLSGNVISNLSQPAQASGTRN